MRRIVPWVAAAIGTLVLAAAVALTTWAGAVFHALVTFLFVLSRGA